MIKNKKIRNSEYLIYIIIIGTYFFLSLALLEQYILGDQRHYHNFYNLIYGIPFSEVGPIARSAIASTEPISLLVLWAGSNLNVDKNLWVSILNCFLILGLVLSLRKYRVPWFTVFLLLTNFYVIVLMVAAERLKIAYIFLLWALVLEGRWRLLFLSLSPLAHLQSIILLAGAFAAYSSETVRKIIVQFSIPKRFVLLAAIATVTVGAIFLYLQDAVIMKGEGYLARSISLTEMLNILLLLIIGILVSRDRFRMILALSPLIVAVALIGGDRVNMIAVSLFIPILVFERRLNHPIVIVLLAYFSVKSIPFIQNIYHYGNGFAGPLY